MGSGKKIVKGAFWTTVQTVVNGIYGFVSVPLLLAYFGKSNYGLIGLAMSINVYLRLMDLGFNTTAVRYFATWNAEGKKEDVKKLFSTNLAMFGGIGLLNAIVLVIISFFSQDIFSISSEQDLIFRHLLYILAISAFISWFVSVFNQLLQGLEYVGWIQKMIFIPKVLQIVILVLTLLLRLDIETYYGLTTFAVFATLPLIILKILKVCPYISFFPKVDVSVLKEILPYSLQIFSFGIFQFSANYLRPVILGIRGSVESISDYRVLFGIVNIVIMLGGAFLNILLPSVSKAVAEGNVAAQNRVAYQGTKYLTMFLCFCSFGVMSVSNDLITAYVGNQYLYLVFWLNLWLISTLSSHIQCLSSIILAGTRLKAITVITIIASVVSIAFCWFLVPMFEVGGAIISYMCFSLILIVFYYFYYYPYVMQINSFEIFFKKVMPFVATGLVSSLIVMNIKMNFGVWGNLLLKGSLFSVLYVFCSGFLLNQSDRSFLLRIMKKNEKKNV